ncbi:NAD(P)/FAD-dependent oxidoreductase [Halosolutus gelatinilyticus]|uniref:NAD(P)/FAD-dependent oxidoreductase n=1 Tax=Halosolutus gelatinilyticus TaxID=2931975 RepID=UPI001FF55064|nr:NAD(P)/FAD-dependent oxidoreductase [Halosolutus gelatinilyticus]
MAATNPDDPGESNAHDRDVVIVGGGPAGCSAGLFCAREGLETVIFDRGRSSIKRCAYLENYLGFPGGVDVETLYGLMHAHADAAGCEIVPDLVESIERAGDAEFIVEPQEGKPITATRVIAATRYDGEYMRGLDDDEAMFVTYDHHGENEEYFDTSYAARDGTTPVDGLYVASPSEEDDQAITAAGRGARVAKCVVADARVDGDWWPGVAERVDWVRREAERTDEWADRETWIEWFDDSFAEDAPIDPESERFRRVREAYVDEALAGYLTAAAIDERTDAGHEALASHLDPEAIVEALDEETLLDVIDDASIRAYAADGE